ncbi:MAG: UDP-N-acetylmuramate dehydrogenase [candidate division Zixibacteria bacterium]|nr:UDP-N-acetylmuramate dehydrogenase [candidate division Zixibacteria bacterium]
MDSQARYDQFITRYGGPVQRNVSLSTFTTFRTGGEADLFVQVNTTDQLGRAVTLAQESGIPYFVLGDGSNLLVSDDGYRGLIVRNRILGLTVEGDRVTAGTGETMDNLVDFATSCSLSGLEFAAGIWGTVGGAVYGNAGAFGSQVGSRLVQAEVMDSTGTVRMEGRDYFQFAYRSSRLKTTKEIVATVTFGLDPGDARVIGKRTEEIRQLRREKHPGRPCSAGCFFKNIEDPRQPGGKIPAGKLLEEAGAKSMRVGDAAVYDKHANIIINAGHATSKEIRQLADILKKKVKDKFDVELEEEVICLGNF